MRILTVLTYYRPHTSGLTIYAERLAKALVARGHEVTVLTSQYEKDLPLEEVQDGVRIVRVPVLFRVSKGVIMPTIGLHAWREALRHDVILLHLPQFDAAGIALRGRLLKKPTAIIYHSDLTLPIGIFNRFVNQVVHFMNRLAARFSHRIAAYTEDFATHSPFLSRYAEKIKVIMPAVVLPAVEAAEVESFTNEHNPGKRKPVLAMATRFAAEKGVEVFLNALPAIFDRFPKATVWYAGQFKDVLGEEAYLQRLLPQIETYQAEGRWKFLDVLSMQQMASFYPNIDILTVPSTNSTETFGFVQIEAMMNGKPTVASNLPGVRQPSRISGMGEVVPIGDSPALAKAIIHILDNPKEYQGDPAALITQFSPDTTAANFEDLFKEIGKDLGRELS
ncbi:MAG: glycosyltransferase family 4 protein [Anaerolineae bacterium]|nr:glycosyltransferase family 4 protein [Anaerolineae bacterium]